jgi:hypothetical protein
VSLRPPARANRRVILDDDEVSSDEDEPLQKRLRQLFGVGPAVLDEATATTDAADKEAADKRATEEATTKRVAEERAAVEAAAKAATAEEVAGKTADEAAGAARAHRPPTRRPCGSKRLHPASQTSLQGCLEISVCPAFSPFFFSVGLHSLITFFAQVLSLRRGHRNGHGCCRCGCRGDSRVGS